MPAPLDAARAHTHRRRSAANPLPWQPRDQAQPCRRQRADGPAPAVPPPQPRSKPITTKERFPDGCGIPVQSRKTHICGGGPSPPQSPPKLSRIHVSNTALGQRARPRSRSRSRSRSLYNDGLSRSAPPRPCSHAAQEVTPQFRTSPGANRHAAVDGAKPSTGRKTMVGRTGSAISIGRPSAVIAKLAVIGGGVALLERWALAINARAKNTG